MTRKDYIIIADIINNMSVSTVDNQQIDKGHIENLADSFIIELRRDNPRFDEIKFLRACGLMLDDLHTSKNGRVVAV